MFGRSAWLHQPKYCHILQKITFTTVNLGIMIYNDSIFFSPKNIAMNLATFGYSMNLYHGYFSIIFQKLVYQHTKDRPGRLI